MKGHDRLTEKRLRVAVVGAGRMARHHALAATRAGASLLGVADPDTGARERLCTDFPGATGFASLAELLARERPDVVHVCTPPATHESLAREALEAGCHVYVEKPFAETRAGAERLLELARQRGLHVCAGHQLLFEAPMRRALALLPALGRLRHVESYFAFRPVRASGPGGGALPADLQLLDVLPHPVYSLLHVLEQAAPAARTELAAVELGPGGTVHALLRRGDLTASLALTLEGRPVESHLHLVGDHGLVHADFVRGTVQHLIGPGSSFVDKTLNPYRQAAQLVFGTTSALFGRLLRRQASYPGLVEIFEAFYAAVRGQGPDPVSAENLLGTAAACEEIARTLERSAPAAAALPAPPRIAVTGGTGFLGRELVALLAAEEPVRVLTRRRPAPWERVPGAEYRVVDLGDEVPESALAGIETVLHLAAETAGGFEAQRRNTLEATEHLCRAAARAGARRLVHVSSLAVLAPGAGSPVREDSPLEPDPEARGPYVWGKLEAERAALRLGQEAGLEVHVVRPGPIVDAGAFDPPGRLGRRIGNWFVAVGSRREPMAVVERAFAARTLAWLAQHPGAAPEVLNLLDPQAPTRLDLVTRLRQRNPGLRVLWLPFPLLRALSRLGVLLQRALRRGRTPVDVAAAFAAERYDTGAAARLAARIAAPAAREPVQLSPQLSRTGTLRP